MTQILSFWTFWIHAAIEEECRNDVEKIVLPRIRSTPGNQRASVLLKDAGDGTIEVDLAVDRPPSGFR